MVYALIAVAVAAILAFVVWRIVAAGSRGASLGAPTQEAEKRPDVPPAEKARAIAEKSADARDVRPRADSQDEHPMPLSVRASTPALRGEATGRGAREEKKTGASVPPSKRDVAGLRKGLAATRGGFIARLTALFAGKKEIDSALLEQLEEVMLTSDVGVKTTKNILDRLRERLKNNELRDKNAVWSALRSEATRILSVTGAAVGARGRPTVILIVGVNGVGKTTTIAKLATKFSGDGGKILFAAGDTFRAAAAQQLEAWGKRVGAEVVRGKEGADPGAVAFEATTQAKAAGVDWLLVDTAGRLHTKLPLMDEIKKVRKTIGKALEGAPHETLLVLDATTGQNALNQAVMFNEALDLTGIVLTKLDGTAKGGVVLGICDELKVPVRYIGLGERAEDLREFNAEDFVEALFGDADEEVAA